MNSDVRCFLLGVLLTLICWGMTLSPSHPPNKANVRKEGIYVMKMNYDRIKNLISTNETENATNDWQSYLKQRRSQLVCEDWIGHQNGLLFLNTSLSDWFLTEHERPLVGFLTADCHYDLVCCALDANGKAFDMTFDEFASFFFAGDNEKP